MKNCPNCNAELPADAKFCPNCGYHFAEAVSQPTPAPQPQPQQAAPQQQPVPPTPTPVQPNPDVEAAKEAGKGYWQYLVHSWAHPLRYEEGTNKYFGLISLGIFALLSTLGVWVGITHITELAGGFMKAGSGSSMMSGAVSAFFGESLSLFYLEFLLAFVLIVAAYMVLGWGVRRLILNDRVNFWSYITEFGHYTNLMLCITLLNVVLVALSFGATYQLVFALISINSLIFNAGFIATILMHRSQGSFDPIYALLIVEIIAALVSFFVFKTFATSIMHMLGGQFNQLKSLFDGASSLFE